MRQQNVYGRNNLKLITTQKLLNQNINIVVLINCDWLQQFFNQKES